MARQIIGDGVYRFGVRSLGAWDANMEQRREDFVLRRVDGSDVRLHPGSVQSSASWRIGCQMHGPFASSPCRVTGLGDRQGFHGLASGDTISRTHSKQCFNERMEAWEASVPVSSANPHLHKILLNRSLACVLVVADITAVDFNNQVIFHHCMLRRSNTHGGVSAQI